MTKNQIKIILDDLGVDFNMMVKLPTVSVISSDLDGCIYAGDSTRFNFNTSGDGILEIYYGKEINGEFIYKNSVPSFIVPFDILYGFTLVGPLHRSEPYKTGQAV